MDGAALGDLRNEERLAFAATQLVGEFDKPRYVALNEGLCAHSRASRTGWWWSRLCPTWRATSPAPCLA